MEEILPAEAVTRLSALGAAIVDQRAARVIVAPKGSGEGYWFGGGNLAESPSGDLYLSGRYRNPGDSREGTRAGERGLELQLFRSKDRGRSFEPILELTKQDLSRDDREVLSIEGSSLVFGPEGVELFVSSEKGNIPYPERLEPFRKPGTGIWSIDVIRADTPAALSPRRIEPLFASGDPEHLHLKDPFVYHARSGDDVILFCTHPFNWTSSSSAIAVRARGSRLFGPPRFGFFPHGVTWDVAMSRITGALPIPPIGLFAGLPAATLYFYDGGESVRKLEEHHDAVHRPRGYSCEELGGLAYALDSRPLDPIRISRLFPEFVSPWGTGSSRYVKTLSTREGIYATWQQSQADRSQPLVLTFLPNDRIAELLA